MSKSQVHLKTVFTVALGTLLIVTVVVVVLHSLFAITLTGAALLLALALEHAVQFLVKRHLPRLVAVAIVALLVLGFLTGIGFTLIPPIVAQGKALIQRGPDYLRKVKESKLVRRLDERFSLSERLEDAEKNGSHVITGAASPVLAAVGGVLSFVGASVTVFFVTIMMLVFGGPLVQAALRQLPRRRQETVSTIAHQVYRSVGGYPSARRVVTRVSPRMRACLHAGRRRWHGGPDHRR